MPSKKVPVKRKAKKTKRSPIGYVMFRIDSGIVNTDEVDLIRNTKSAKHLAKLIIEEERRDDRYANPEHPHYDPEYAEDKAEEYQRRFDDARYLRNVALSADDDLILLKVFDYIDVPTRNRSRAARKKKPKPRKTGVSNV